MFWRPADSFGDDGADDMAGGALGTDRGREQTTERLRAARCAVPDLGSGASHSDRAHVARSRGAARDFERACGTRTRKPSCCSPPPQRRTTTTTGRHLHGIRAITEALARELGYDEESAEAIGLAAMLHDIGKIRVPDSILANPATLSTDDWAVMKQHTVWGAEFLSGRPEFARPRSSPIRITSAGTAPATPTVYPVRHSRTRDDRLGGGRFDALISDRPYRKGGSVRRGGRGALRLLGQAVQPQGRRSARAAQRARRAAEAAAAARQNRPPNSQTVT